ncbi:hypothetical protein BH18ACI4_BH18ACI4_13780 [soil metagenome]
MKELIGTLSQEKGRNLSLTVLWNRVERLCSLSGGALRFAPFLPCEFGALELSIEGLPVTSDV